MTKPKPQPVATRPPFGDINARDTQVRAAARMAHDIQCGHTIKISQAFLWERPGTYWRTLRCATCGTREHHIDRSAT